MIITSSTYFKFVEHTSNMILQKRVLLFSEKVLDAKRNTSTQNYNQFFLSVTFFLKCQIL